MNHRQPTRCALLVLAALLVTGAELGLWAGHDPTWAFERGAAWATHPVGMLVLVLAMALMLTIALPGTLMLVLVAPFHPLVIAVPMLLTGSLLGAFCAYHLSHRFKPEWPAGSISARLSALMHRHSDFLTQLALRVLPGFPHAVVNFSGGLLGLSLTTFLAAAAIGLAVKWSVCAGAVHGAVHSIASGDGVGIRALLPLFLLAALLLTGALLRRALLASGRKAQNEVP